MALSQSVASELLEAFRAGEGVDLVRTLHQFVRAADLGLQPDKGRFSEPKLVRIGHESDRSTNSQARFVGNEVLPDKAVR
jgi:hypothetical protein